METIFETQTENEKKIEEIKKVLLPHQLESLKYIKWLLYGGRATGRTYTMCVVTILYAMENIGIPVKIYDHIPHRFHTGDFELFDLRSILEKNDLLKYFELNRNNKTITYNPMRSKL